LDLIPYLERAQAFAHRTLAGVTPDQLAAPTPCTDWDVRQLLSHIAGGARAFADAAEGQGEPAGGYEYTVVDIPGAAADYREAAERMAMAWRQPHNVARTVAMPFGEVPGSVALNIAFLEACTHGWDLARATGQPIDLDEETAEVALRVARVMFARAGRRGASFQAEQPAPEGAPTMDRLAAYMGRHLG